MIRMVNNVQYLGSGAAEIARALHGRQGTLVNLLTPTAFITGEYVGYRPEQRKFFLLDATTTSTRVSSSSQRTDEVIVDSDSVLRAYAHF